MKIEEGKLTCSRFEWRVETRAIQIRAGDGRIDGLTLVDGRIDERKWRQLLDSKGGWRRERMSDPDFGRERMSEERLGIRFWTWTLFRVGLLH